MSARLQVLVLQKEDSQRPIYERKPQNVVQVPWHIQSIKLPVYLNFGRVQTVGIMFDR